MMHDDARYGVLWVDRRGLASAFGMVGAFNDVALRLAPGASEREVIARVDATLERYGGLGAVGRGDQSSHHFVKGELEELSTWATLLPSIFVGVAAFLLNVVLSRLIGTQREQIAVLKAFGYSNLRVGAHYLQMIGVIVVLGSVLGTALGWFLGSGLTERYSLFFRFPELSYQLDASVVAAGTGITLLAAALGGIGAVLRPCASRPQRRCARPHPRDSGVPSWRGSGADGCSRTLDGSWCVTSAVGRCAPLSRSSEWASRRRSSRWGCSSAIRWTASCRTSSAASCATT
jgi:putative ABC transport system permease protein